LFENLRDLPCVLFDAKPSLQIISVSENIGQLLGVRISMVREPGFLAQRVMAEDRSVFQEKLAELENSGAVSFVHRFTQDCGLPVWVSHSLRRVSRDGQTIIRGCLVPIPAEPRLLALDQEVVARFIHKLGNQFQLLGLVIASIQESLPRSRESNLLQEALEKAIDLTRVLADCNQAPSWPSEIPLLDVLRAAVASRTEKFKVAGTILRAAFAEIPEDVVVPSCPYLLETAFGNILENALEASGNSGTVEFSARLELHDQKTVASLRIIDAGCGIANADLNQITSPFFTTRKGRDGLGLAVAARFIEIHGGALRIQSEKGSGTDVTILLPVDRRRDPLCA
jgi:signal transduction histidine kinase